MRKALVTAAVALALATSPASARLRPLGEPFALDDCAECSDPSPASIAGGTAGRFFAVWGAELPGVAFAAFGRAFDGDGGLHPTRRLGIDPARSTSRESVGADAEGAFTLLWQHPGEIWLDRLDAAGEPVAPSLRVNTPPTSIDDDLARVGVDPSGWAAAAFFTVADDPTEVWAQVVAPDNRIVGPAVQLSGTFPVAILGGLHVAAVGDTGSFFVLWETRASADEPIGDPGPRGLSLRRVNRQGAVEGPEIVLRSPSGSARTLGAALSGDPRGELVVATWSTREEPATAGVDAVAQLLAADGTTLGSPFVLSKKRGGAQREASVAFTRRGQLVAVWETLKNGRSRIWARKLRRDGRFRGREQPLVDSLPDPGATSEFGSLWPKIAVVAGGRAVVVWHDGEPLGRFVSGAR